MTYEQIVNLIFTVLTTFFSSLTFYGIVFVVIGLFSYKKFPQAKKLRKYAVVIAARNEAVVVGNLVESIRRAKYPQELISVFVAAHNCTDDTAEVARNAGAVVYQYDNPNERMKGYALKYLFQCIERDYGTKNFDGFIFFDADNLLDENYFAKMNDAFEYYDEEYIITSYRNSKNFGQNLISGMYGVHFSSVCILDSRGRTICGCSTKVHGTGFLVSSQVMKDGWNYLTISEDWEFCADQIMQGRKVMYCEEAIFYDEQPTSLKIMLRQRLRWAKGTLMVVKTKGARLLSNIFKPNVKNRGSHYDFFATVLPYTIISLALSIIQTILLSPLFGVPLFDGLPFAEYLANNYMGWVYNVVGSYLYGVVQASLVFVLARNKIRNVSTGKKVAVCLLFPVFGIIGTILQVVALFAKVDWKPIPHNSTVTHDVLNTPATEVAATVVTEEEE